MICLKIILSAASTKTLVELGSGTLRNIVLSAPADS